MTTNHRPGAGMSPMGLPTILQNLVCVWPGCDIHHHDGLPLAPLMQTPKAEAPQRAPAKNKTGD